MAQQALITPDVLAWARDRAQMSIDALSARLPTKAERVEAWEKGELKPTFNQAQKLARVLHIPFGYLFLSAPPEEKLPIPDLRTIGDNEPETITPVFRDLLNDVKRKQAWYRDYAIENGEEPFAYLGKFSVHNGVIEVSDSIREALSLTAFDHTKCRDKDAYLKLLTEKIEALGVLVMRNSVVGSNTSRSLNVHEFRGFAISDTYAPLIFINSSDANSAKIFTLIHELAHLWIDESGISSVDLSEADNNDTEKFCNAISAEVLVPKGEFSKRWDNQQDVVENAIATAQYFKVSTFVTARRAWNLGFIDAKTFFAYYREASEQFEEIRQKRRAESQGGGNPYANTWSRNGKRFSRAVAEAALSQSVLLRDAGAMLNMNPNNVLDFANKLGVK